MITQTITTHQDKQLFYRKAGEGPVVVLLHGFPEDGSLWEQVIPGLASSFTLLVPDLPGTGNSHRLNAGFGMDDLARSVADLLDHEQVQAAVIVGHSMGGYTALAFADLFPERVKGISLVHSTATADTDEKKETRRKSIELIQKGGKEPFVKGMIPNLFSKAFQEQNPELLRKQVERGLRLENESMTGFYTAMINRPDRTAILSSGKAPVQWIIGKEDNVVPLESALQQSKLSDVNFVSVYENCGHMSMLEQPERLTTDLKDFISYCYNR